MQTPTQPVSPEAIAAGHEPEAFPLRGYLIFLIGFIVLSAVFFIGCWFVMDFTSHTESEQSPPAPPGMMAEQQRPAPPNLQPSPMDEHTPAQDLQQMRYENNEMLNRYSWADFPHGIVRVPINQAIDEVAKQGLPTTMNAEESP